MIFQKLCHDIDTISQPGFITYSIFKCDQLSEIPAWHLTVLELKLTNLCHGLKLCPLKFHRLEPNPQRDGVRGWGLWKVTKVSLRSGVWGPMIGLVPS